MTEGRPEGLPFSPRWLFVLSVVDSLVMGLLAIFLLRGRDPDWLHLLDFGLIACGGPVLLLCGQARLIRRIKAARAGNA